MQRATRRRRGATRVRRIADLFSGAGNLSAGARTALDARGESLALAAINHNPDAIRVSEAVFPGQRHFCARIDAVRPLEAVPEGHLDALLAGPSCRSHSRARGWAEVDDGDRIPAFAILDWALALHIDRILVENVPEFPTWQRPGSTAPLDANGEGEVFRLFTMGFTVAGYEWAYRRLKCADYGDPTGRVRFFLQARRDGKPIRWPEPTHGPAGSGRTPWRTAASILDWSNLGVPVSAKRHRLSRNTLDRIEVGRARFGRAFILPRRQHALLDVRSVERPLPTVMAGSTDIALVQERRGVLYHRALTVPELAAAHSIGPEMLRHFPRQKKTAVRLIGNGVPQRTAAALVGAMFAD